MKHITLFLLAALAGALTLAAQAPQKESGKQTGPPEYVLKQTLTGYTGKVFGVAFSPDGQLLAVSSEDKTLLWDVQTGALVRTLSGHTKGVNSVAFSPDGRLLASASVGDKVELWDVQTGALVRTLTGHTESLIAAAFSPDGRLLAAASFALEVRVWDVQTGAIVRQFAQQKVRTFKSHAIDMALRVAFSRGAHLLAWSTFNNPNTVVLWDVQTGAMVRTLTGHTERVESVAFSPDGQLLAVGSDDKTVKLWDVQTGAIIQTLTGHTKEVSSVAFSPDGRLLASVSEDNAVKLWRRPE